MDGADHRAGGGEERGVLCRAVLANLHLGLRHQPDLLVEAQRFRTNDLVAARLGHCLECGALLEKAHGAQRFRLDVAAREADAPVRYRILRHEAAVEAEGEAVQVIVTMSIIGHQRPADPNQLCFVIIRDDLTFADRGEMPEQGADEGWRRRRQQKPEVAQARAEQGFREGDPGQEVEQPVPIDLPARCRHQQHRIKDFDLPQFGGGDGAAPCFGIGARDAGEIAVLQDHRVAVKQIGLAADRGVAQEMAARRGNRVDPRVVGVPIRIARHIGNHPQTGARATLLRRQEADMAAPGLQRLGEPGLRCERFNRDRVHRISAQTLRLAWSRTAPSVASKEISGDQPKAAAAAALPQA